MKSLLFVLSIILVVGCRHSKKTTTTGAKGIYICDAIYNQPPATQKDTSNNILDRLNKIPGWGITSKDTSYYELMFYSLGRSRVDTMNINPLLKWGDFYIGVYKRDTILFKISEWKIIRPNVIVE